MGNLLINKFSYSGDNYYYQTPTLKSGINILEGENGNGKTTFMDLIYYGLGGSVKQFKIDDKNNNNQHEQLRIDTNNYVELDISINYERFILRRSIGKNFISVVGSKGEVTVLAINRSENEPYTFSDWILERLGIDVVEIFQGDRRFKINITDLFRLIYHDQNPDPRKVYKAPDQDNFISDSEEVRQAIFRLLLGKTYSKYYKVLADFKKAEQEKNAAQAVLNEFKEFSCP